MLLSFYLVHEKSRWGRERADTSYPVHERRRQERMDTVPFEKPISKVEYIAALNTVKVIQNPNLKLKDMVYLKVDDSRADDCEQFARECKTGMQNGPADSG